MSEIDYVVKISDSLAEIAKQLKTTNELLLKLVKEIAAKK